MAARCSVSGQAAVLESCGRRRRTNVLQERRRITPCGGPAFRHSQVGGKYGATIAALFAALDAELFIGIVGSPHLRLMAQALCMELWHRSKTASGGRWLGVMDAVFQGRLEDATHATARLAELELPLY